MGGVFSRLREVERLEQISAALIKHELGYVLTRIGLREGHKKKRELQPEALVKVCEELGGSFIKLGQFLSLRPDLLPHEYSEAFASLQDKVPPFPGDEAKRIVAEQLGKPLTKVFSHFADQPIAAASIGQVHRAKLITGEHVAVKVMRPDARERIMTDLLLLYRLATLINHHYDPKVFDPLRIVEEFRRYTEGELNYLGEMQSLKAVADNFKGIKRVRIPKPYEQWCTERVLTMEFLSGEPLRPALKKMSKQRRHELAKEITHVLLKQVLIDGYFHADLHPGNILILPHGQLGLIDFGIVGTIDEETKEYLVILLLSLLDKDMDGVIKAMARLHFFDDQKDELKLKEALKVTLGPYYGVSVDKVDIAALFIACIRVAQDNQLHVPSELVLLGKAIVTLKGLVEEIDPGFDIIVVAKPFMAELLQRQASLDGLVKKATKDAIRIKSFVSEIPQMTEDFFVTTNRIDRDLQQIGFQIQTFSKDMTLMLSQAFILLFVVVFAGLVIIALDVGPFVFGFSLLSLLSASLAVLLFLVFLRTFFKIRF